jgi:hypothetical protein
MQLYQSTLILTFSQREKELFCIHLFPLSLWERVGVRVLLHLVSSAVSAAWPQPSLL